MKNKLIIPVLLALALTGCGPTGGDTPQVCLDALDAAEAVNGAHQEVLETYLDVIEKAPKAVEDAMNLRSAGITDLTKTFEEATDVAKKAKRTIDNADFEGKSEKCRGL